MLEELLPVILGLIESDNSRYAKVIEDLDVVFRGVSTPFKFVEVVQWAHECDELAWNDPVQVAVLDLLVVFVFLVIKVLEIVPAKLNGKLKTLQTVLNRARIRAIDRI